MAENCIFCRIAADEIPANVVHKTDRVIAFRDLAPKAPVHVLVIPRGHHENVAALAAADPQTAAELLDVAAAVAESEGVLDSGWRLQFNSGPDAGQEVFHVHAHVLGGRPLGPMLAG